MLPARLPDNTSTVLTFLIRFFISRNLEWNLDCCTTIRLPKYGRSSGITFSTTFPVTMLNQSNWIANWNELDFLVPWCKLHNQSYGNHLTFQRRFDNYFTIFFVVINRSYHIFNHIQLTINRLQFRFFLRIRFTLRIFIKMSYFVVVATNCIRTLTIVNCTSVCDVTCQIERKHQLS